MDQAQFTEFMKSQQELMAQMMQMVVEGRGAVQSPPSTNSALLPNFENFDSSKESFRSYIKRFQNYTEMKGISNNKEYCAKLLLNSMGAKFFNMASALTAPKNLSEVKYDDLLKLLETHLSPKKNVLVTQHQFLSKYQTEGQSIAEYVASLRAEIGDCEFVTSCRCESSVAELFLRAQFIRGICDNNLREQLLLSGSSKFEDIVEKAIAIEAAKADSKEMTAKATIPTPSVNRIVKSKNNKVTHQQGKINYKKLGIEGLCLRCGRNNHYAKECRTDKNKLKCTGCNKKGHVAKVCIATLSKSSNTMCSQNTKINQIGYDEDYGVYKVVEVYQNNSSNTSLERYYTNIEIEGKVVKFEVDSGSGFTFLPRSQFNSLKLSTPVIPTNIVFRSYTQTTFIPDGKIKVQAKYNKSIIRDEIYIVPDGCAALLGRSWIRRLKINLNELADNYQTPNTADINQVSVIDEIIHEFPEVFEEKIGCTRQYKISLKLREGATPIYNKERQIPYSLTERVENELDALERAGIIAKTTNSDWGSPLVVIPKADGGVRLCVDYKVGVNQRLIDAHYPIRKIENIFSSLRDSRYFCRLDLYKAYLHIPVDEQSSLVQTISTHRGTYKMQRLSFGIKTAPAEFNRIIDQILRGVPKTEAYFDDIIVHGSSMEECTSNLRACLLQLKRFDLHLNRNKCSFFKKSIEFLGHIIEFNTIKKSPSKVSAILNMPTPDTVDSVRRFLGMVTYYARFIPNISSLTTPLRNLLKKDAKFNWTNQCTKAFNTLKQELASDRVLVPYNPSLSVQLACDAGPTGIAGVLSHVLDGQERPIAYASRALSPAEQNYSQLDREALSIIFAVQHFHEYLFARRFILITDNQPIMRIFHQTSKLPQMTSARLQRYAAYLSGFDYEIQLKKGIDNVNADCLSRAPDTVSKFTECVINQEVHLICSEKVQQICSSKINYQLLRDETRKDTHLMQIIQKLQKFNKNDDLDPEFTIDSGVLFRGQRIVIPTVLQPHILQELHYTHLGITKMKQLARRYVYWKAIDRNIEELVRSCPSCAVVKSSPTKAKLHPWEEPVENWQRVHIDYAGPFQSNFFLVVMDAKSKWAEIGITRTPPSSSSTIDILKEIFSRNGYPNFLVSDNATIFTSEEFKIFCKNCGIFQKFIAPGHPATNGLAERNIQTLKHKLITMADENTPIRDKVQEILFKYRATPLRNNKTPAEQYLGRQIRIRLDALKPIKFTKTQYPKSMARQLFEGERVMARYYSANKMTWKSGKIIRKLGNLHYIVQLDNGFVFKRHINQLRPSNVQPSIPEVTNEEVIVQNENNSQQKADIKDLVEVPNSSTGSPQQASSSTQQTVSPRQQPPSPNIQPPSTVSRQRTSGRTRKIPRHLSDYIIGSE